MNYIATLSILALSTVGSAATLPPDSTAEPSAYQILYVVRPNPTDGTINVTLQLTQARRLLRELRFNASQRVSGIHADGDLEIESDEVTWHPSETGGALHWTVSIAHRRDGASRSGRMVQIRKPFVPAFIDGREYGTRRHRDVSYRQRNQEGNRGFRVAG